MPYILINEMGERFSFYGTKCILVIFMTKYLMNTSGVVDVMSSEESRTYFHLFMSIAYLAPIFGALISDIWLGKYKTILYFSFIYCIGLFVLVLDNTRLGFTLGLTFIAIGAGIIKPCISANVGDQFGKTNKHLMGKIYSWFYFAINFGAFLSILSVPLLLDKFGPRIAFCTSSVFMLFATIAFWVGGRKFVHIPASGMEFVKESLSGEGIKAIGRLLIIYLFVAMFFALKGQSASAWVLQAGQMNRRLLGFECLPSQVQVVNSLFILILIPLFSFVIYPIVNKIFYLTPLRKISIGFFVTAFAFAVSAWIEMRIVAGIRPSIWWQIFAYAIITAGEVMVSITCLEFSYTQAPKKMKSFIMALFFLSASLGNAFTAIVNVFIQNEDGYSKLPGASYYWFFTMMMMFTAVIFIFVAKSYHERSYLQT